MTRTRVRESEGSDGNRMCDSGYDVHDTEDESNRMKRSEADTTGSAIASSSTATSYSLSVSC